MSVLRARGVIAFNSGVGLVLSVLLRCCVSVMLINVCVASSIFNCLGERGKCITVLAGVDGI